MPNLKGFLRAAQMDRALRRNERLDRAGLEALQRERLARIVAHARAHSPFYRELYARHGVDETSPLAALPPVGKRELMERFDDWIVDRRIRLADAERHLASGTEEPMAGEFVVIASGGSSRQPGIYVFDREAWTTVVAGTLRTTRWHGITPRIPRRRMVFVQAPGARHMAGRVARDLGVGVHRTLRLSATQPRAKLVEALNDFRPTVLTGYASIIALLAAEQLDGRLTIRPEIVSTSSEPRTAEMTERITAAWGRRPFDLYATTETGMLALDCSAHHGQHVFEDLTIVEVVDADDRPVPDGEPGDHLLVTNLFNRTQPFIRYRLNDMTAFQVGQCGCGVPFRLLAAVDGRTDDVLGLAGADGQPVQVHPTAFSPLFGLDGVAELDIAQRGAQLHITVVPRNGAEPEALAHRIAERTRAMLDSHGCTGTPIEVHTTTELHRHPVAGKLKLIRRED